MLEDGNHGSASAARKSRSRLRRERDKQRMREQILDAARELFALQGYEAVTMRKIAEKIEYTTTLIYSHFPDKETLIREIVAHDFQSFGRNSAAVPRSTIRSSASWRSHGSSWISASSIRITID